MTPITWGATASHPRVIVVDIDEPRSIADRGFVFRGVGRPDSPIAGLAATTADRARIPLWTLSGLLTARLHRYSLWSVNLGTAREEAVDRPAQESRPRCVIRLVVRIHRSGRDEAWWTISRTSTSGQRVRSSNTSRFGSETAE